MARLTHNIRRHRLETWMMQGLPLPGNVALLLAPVCQLLLTGLISMNVRWHRAQPMEYMKKSNVPSAPSTVQFDNASTTSDDVETNVENTTAAENSENGSEGAPASTDGDEPTPTSSEEESEGVLTSPPLSRNKLKKLQKELFLRETLSAFSLFSAKREKAERVSRRTEERKRRKGSRAEQKREKAERMRPNHLRLLSLGKISTRKRGDDLENNVEKSKTGGLTEDASVDQVQSKTEPELQVSVQANTGVLGNGRRPTQQSRCLKDQRSPPKTSDSSIHRNRIKNLQRLVVGKTRESLPKPRWVLNQLRRCLRTRCFSRIKPVKKSKSSKSAMKATRVMEDVIAAEAVVIGEFRGGNDRFLQDLSVRDHF
ncbi:hypothetical protein BC829DRAFT_420781 [Chytridium lagenaria]|nr:hypothetical protein BC829DRAFT_420781 [Chytridium lagenaria]